VGGTSADKTKGREQHEQECSCCHRTPAAGQTRQRESCPPPGWAPSIVSAGKLWVVGWVLRRPWHNVPSPPSLGDQQQRRGRKADVDAQRGSNRFGDAGAFHLLRPEVAHVFAGRRARHGGFEHGPDDVAAVGYG